jgi:hypothetical protein
MFLTFQNKRELKEPTDYRPACNSYPSQDIRRDDDTLGPSELECSFVSWGEYLLFRPATNIEHSTDKRGGVTLSS